MIYLGLRKLFFEEPAGGDEPAPEPRSLPRLFVQGMVVNVLNPKTALFFLAFLPGTVYLGLGVGTALAGDGRK